MGNEDQPEAKPFGIGAWHIQDDGWVSIPVSEDETDASLHVRIQPAENGRLVITDMLLSASRVTAELLRNVQPARIEAAFNLHRSDGATVEHMIAADVLQLGRADDGLTLGDLRRRTPVLPAEPSARHILGRPDGTDPDGFYRRVAEAYKVAAMQSRRPAVDLAEDADVPVTTVHRWIREARRRGFLPPAQKGVAG